jgi:hypothetical protein
MGDPTLRMHPVLPPGQVSVSAGAGGAHIAWQAPAETGIAGYNIYAASSAEGPFTKLNTDPVAASSFDSADSPAGGVYMVKTVKLETSASGSYYNSSEGVIATPAAAPIPLRISAAQGGFRITFPSEAGRLYVVEASANLKTWLPVATITGTEASSAITEALHSPAAFYRVRGL